MMLPLRFWQKVEFTASCWLWHGATVDGYGQFKWEGKVRYAHRLTYAMFGGLPIGSLDHLCRVRNCVNPAHLEQVDTRTNNRRGLSFAGLNARKAVCYRGHPFDDRNTRVTEKGRVCRACAADYARGRYWADPETERARSAKRRQEGRP